MARGATQRLVTCLAISLMAAVAGCGSGDEKVSDKEVFGQNTRSSGLSQRDVVKGKFDAGARKLYMECRGSGHPTVVFLHGSVRERQGSGIERAGELPALLDDRNRVCVYDRANVGKSDSARGPLTGRSSARDLHALLASAGEHGPYVLLGASLGGAISDIYAAQYPHDVAGMVLLDSTLPAYLDMYKRLYPPGSGPQPNEWKSETERLDRLATFRQAGEVQGRKAQIPVTYIAAAISLPPKIEVAIREAQREFIARFAPGRMVVVDAPHSMVPVIPERIAREVRQVVAAARRE